MSDNSARLTLPYIAPNQAQKHVTHNEAIERLDAVTQLSVVQFDAIDPPVDPASGAVYGLGQAPTGAWAGEAGRLAYRSESGWLFMDPQTGWRAWDQQSAGLFAFSGGTWTAVSGGGGGGSTQNTDGLGIQTSWDMTNRLAVSANASLFSHEGSGHQVKINKAGAADTASLLFQSDWTGHAEFGLTGDTAFSIKVSADGATWQDALRCDPVAGVIDAGLPLTGAAVQSAPEDVTPGRLMRADYGYGPGNAVGVVSQVGGLPTGAIVESGETATGRYTRWADGTQICWGEADAVFDEPRRLAVAWTFPVAFAAGTAPMSLAMLQSETGVAPAEDEILGPVVRRGPAPSEERCVARIYRSANGTDFAPSDALPLSFVAFGRWF